MRITLRLKDDEHAAIKAAADTAGITVSDYVRKRIEGHAVVAKTPPLSLLEAEAGGWGLAPSTPNWWPGGPTGL